MTAAPSLSAALCALLFVGLSLVQAFLTRRATRATGAAMKELRAAMKESFQRHHASLEILAKMIRAQPGERFSIELPHAPDFEIAPAAAALAPAAPATQAPSAPRCEPPAVPSSALTDATPESQRPTLALVTSDASRPTVALAAKRGGLGAALAAIEAAAQGRDAPEEPVAAPGGEDDCTSVMRRPPEVAPVSLAPVTPTRLSAQGLVANRGEARG